MGLKMNNTIKNPFYMVKNYQKSLFLRNFKVGTVIAIYI